MNLLHDTLKPYYYTLSKNQRRMVYRDVTTRLILFPFGTRESVLIEWLIRLKVLSYFESLSIQQEFAKRNKYSKAFQKESAAFGKTFMRNHLKSKIKGTQDSKIAQIDLSTLMP